MIISLIAAMAKNRVIGLNNQMPWHLPADFAHFKKITMGKPIIMGRKTFESIGKPLPGRKNIVISRQTDLQLDSAEVCSSLVTALKAVGNVDEVVIIGGGLIFQQALTIADRMYLTFIDSDAEGDAFFPEWDENEWELLESKKLLADGKNEYDCLFVTFARKAA